MALRQLPWQLTCALFAVLTAADIVPANSSTGIQSFRGTIQLQDANTRENLTRLEPLTKDAVLNQPLESNNLYNTNGNTVANISDGEIAYLSCNPNDYDGFMGPVNILEDAFNNNISAAILYSTITDYCNYTNISEMLQDSLAIFTMTSIGDSRSVLDTLNRLSVPYKFFVNIRLVGGREDSPQGFNGQTQNPLGPSPSTAVAMIILYSITGIITALFLVIIITGAIRAHRHPDRYGPRDVLGRPRQSRARGLGRAILDTIPIVKFGEREAPKPTDVELGSTSESRNVNDATTGPETTTQNNQPSEPETQPTNQTETPRDAVTEQQSGIAPAEAPAAGAAAAQENPSSDETLGCSICTDDFEKGQDIRLLPCNHKFHPECVDPWLLNVSGTCPLCRVDLRPTTSHTSADENEHDPNLLAPPLQPETDVSHRRRSALRDILSLRARPNASPEERISALRRLREQHRNASGDVASGSENASSEDITTNRRSKRISVRLSDVFGGRTRHRRDESPQPGEPSSSSAQLPREGSPRPHSNNDNTEERDPTRRM